MAEPIRIAVEFTGTDDAVRGTTRVSDGLENMSDRSSAAARTTDQLAARQTAAATSAIAFGQRLAAAASAVQGITSALGVEGQAAGLIGKITQTSTAMAQLGATFGPQGALVGGIIGAAIPAIQALIGQTDALIREQERLEEVMSRQSSQRQDQIRREVESGRIATLSSAEISRQSLIAEQRIYEQRQRQQELQSELIRNRAQAEEQTGRGARRSIESIQAEIEASTSEVQNLVGLVGTLGAAEARLQSQENARREQQERSARPSVSAASAASSGGRGRAATPQAAAVDEGDAMAVVRDIIGEQNAALAEQLELMEALNRQKAEAQDKDASIAAARAEQHEVELERQTELKDSLIESADKQREVADRQRQEYMGVTSVIAGGLNDALQAIIAGNKTAEEAFTGLLASFLKYISEQSMLKAIYEYAEAIASFASYKYDQGAQHLAAGIAYTAVAVAAGAGAAALSAPSAKGSSEEKPASPESGRGDGGGGGGDIVINWNSPVVTAGTRAELGRDMAGMIRAGTQRYGTV